MEEIFETLRNQNTISRPINSSTMDKDITKPKMVFHRNVHTAKVI